MGAHSSNIVIVGSGVSAMSAALTAIEAGATVSLVSRCIPARSGSAGLREGLNARFDGEASAHASDTLAAACGLADGSAVLGMCAAAPGIARLLAGMGLVLDRTHGEGRVRESRTCGSSRAMTVSSGRATGARVLSALCGQMLRHEAHGRLRPFYGWEFLSLILPDDRRCRGIVAQDLRNMELRAFPADAVILCTGGYGALFGSHCVSLSHDGFAAVRAMEQGAAFANPEFVELMPFTLPAAGRNRAVVDAVLTEGGRAYMERDGRPWYFLEEYFPETDGRVARARGAAGAIRARASLGKGAGPLMLDLSGIDPAVLEGRLSAFVDVCDGLVAPIEGAIEVEPAVGPTLGGLFVDRDHATTVPGLFAAGSCAFLYHGAGSLAGNELLASAHGGMIAGAKAAEAGTAACADEPPLSLLERAVELEEDGIARISAREGRENAHAIEEELGRILFGCIAAGKDNETLARAAGSIVELHERLERAPLSDRSEWANGELFFARRLEGELKLARMFVDASIAREESRGCHFKPARPEANDAKWRALTKAWWKDGEVVLDHATRIAD